MQNLIIFQKNQCNIPEGNSKIQLKTYCSKLNINTI